MTGYQRYSRRRGNITLQAGSEWILIFNSLPKVLPIPLTDVVVLGKCTVAESFTVWSPYCTVLKT